MVAIETYQIVIVLVFLGLLFALQIWLRKNPKRFLKHQLSRNIQVIEVSPLSPQERLTLVRASGQDFLLYTSKTSGCALLQVPSANKEPSYAPILTTAGETQ